MRKKINIHVTVSANSIPYYEYLVKNFLQLSSGCNDLLFFAHCLDVASLNYLKSHQATYKCIPVYKLPKFFVVQNFQDKFWQIASYFGMYRSMRGSNGHSAGLNSSLSLTGEGGINIISDSDVVILKKNWDSWVVDTLKVYGIIGTSYEAIGGKSSGSGFVQTYKDKPTLTWCALSEFYDWRLLDTSPEKSSNLKIDSLELSALYNLPVGYELVRDAAWKVPAYLKNQSITYIVLKQVKSEEGIAYIKSGEGYHEEYQLDGVPILAHQRGSHQHAFRKSPLSVSFYSACEAYLTNEYGKNFS
jgi:hypothetical protein